MKTQILPNWCKKLGLTLFIIASLLNGSLNFINNSINKYGVSGINSSELGEQSSNEILVLLNAFTGGAFANASVFQSVVRFIL